MSSSRDHGVDQNDTRLRRYLRRDHSRQTRNVLETEARQMPEPPLTLVPFIRTMVGKGSSSKSVPSTVSPLAIVGSLIFLVHHASTSVGHPGGLEDNARVVTLISVRIQNHLIRHLLSIFTVGRTGHRLTRARRVVDKTDIPHRHGRANVVGIGIRRWPRRTIVVVATTAATWRILGGLAAAAAIHAIVGASRSMIRFLLRLSV